MIKRKFAPKKHFFRKQILLHFLCILIRRGFRFRRSIFETKEEEGRKNVDQVFVVCVWCFFSFFLWCNNSLSAPLSPSFCIKMRRRKGRRRTRRKKAFLFLPSFPPPSFSNIFYRSLLWGCERRSNFPEDGIC